VHNELLHVDGELLPVHDELDQLLPELLPVLSGLGVALELGLFLLCCLAACLFPAKRDIVYVIFFCPIERDSVTRSFISVFYESTSPWPLINPLEPIFFWEGGIFFLLQL
jgi:hypothetical protein